MVHWLSQTRTVATVLYDDGNGDRHAAHRGEVVLGGRGRQPAAPAGQLLLAELRARKAMGTGHGTAIIGARVGRAS